MGGYSMKITKFLIRVFLFCYLSSFVNAAQASVSRVVEDSPVSNLRQNVIRHDDSSVVLAGRRRSEVVRPGGNLQTMTDDTAKNQDLLFDVDDLVLDSGEEELDPFSVAIHLQPQGLSTGDCDEGHKNFSDENLESACSGGSGLVTPCEYRARFSNIENMPLSKLIYYFPRLF
jgi:hypothetical protein